ncbi:MAG TPA: exonuclease SbcCD subunit D [Acidobacteriota bacterium]|nr:exonuclease SbcCD subunit D [Acidobacteriota bacterium]
MRFLHTGDWHVGKMLRGRSRIWEQEAVLNEILEIASSRQVDLVLVAGDLFESHAPSPEAERVVYGFLARLAQRHLPTLVIGGNHDHPKRLAALSALLQPLGIFVRPEPAAANEGGVIELEAGGEKVKVACLPFVSERRVVDACQLMGPEEEWFQEYKDRVGQMCRMLAESFQEDTVNILMAHLHVFGAETSGSERAIHVAHPYAVDAGEFPESAQYVALGHLHRPQQIHCPVPCHYCGSTLQLDFGEQMQEKRVVVGTAEPGRPAELESVPLKAGRPLRDVSGTLDELKKQSEEWADSYLRVTVKLEEPVPGIADQVREAFPNAIDVRARYPRTEEPVRHRSVSSLAPADLFQHFYRKQHGAEPPPAVAALFSQLYEEVLDASDSA